MPGLRPFPAWNLDNLPAEPGPSDNTSVKSTTRAVLPPLDATVTMTGGLAGSMVATASAVAA